MPIAAAQRTGFSRWIHVKAGQIAIVFVTAVTLFSLCTQAYVLGSQGSTIAFQLGVSPGVLVLSVLPHALPELVALFLPLAAWLIASRRGEWNQLLAATVATTFDRDPCAGRQRAWSRSTSGRTRCGRSRRSSEATSPRLDSRHRPARGIRPSRPLEGGGGPRAGRAARGARLRGRRRRPRDFDRGSRADPRPPARVRRRPRPPSRPTVARWPARCGSRKRCGRSRSSSSAGDRTSSQRPRTSSRTPRSPAGTSWGPRSRRRSPTRRSTRSCRSPIRVPPREPRCREKLGINPGTTVALMDAPEGFEAILGELPAGVALRRGSRGRREMTIWFTTSAAELARRLPAVARHVGEGTLWIAWPKGSSGIATDLTRHR